ncbi:MAG: rubrerythrin [Bacillota bacterium]
MELKGTRTEANLWAAFAGESQARNKYTYFASAARKEGYEQIAAVFQETADNEKEHAKTILKLLKGIGSTSENLRAATEGEHHEWSSMYPEFARVAEEEGFPEIAAVLRRIAEVERHHEQRYQAILRSIEDGKVFRREGSVRWKCRNCGYIHEGPEAPESCPACAHPRAYFEVLCENWER